MSKCWKVKLTNYSIKYILSLTLTSTPSYRPRWPGSRLQLLASLNFVLDLAVQGEPPFTSLFVPPDTFPLVYRHCEHSSPSSGSSPHLTTVIGHTLVSAVWEGNSRLFSTCTWSVMGCGLWGSCPLALQSPCPLGKGDLKSTEQRGRLLLPKFKAVLSSREMWSKSQDGVRACIPQILESWMDFSQMPSVIKAASQWLS